MTRAPWPPCEAIAKSGVFGVTITESVHLPVSRKAAIRASLVADWYWAANISELSDNTDHPTALSSVALQHTELSRKLVGKFLFKS